MQNETKNLPCLIGAIIAIVLICAVLLLILFLRPGSSPQGEELESDKPSASILSDEEVSAMASDVLAGTSFDPAFSYGYTDPVYFGYSPKYPCSTLEEGKALSLEQLDENIADLQAKYLDYLKSCQSEELKDQAQNLYAQKLEWFRYVKTVKTRTPDQEQELHETAFYHMYDEIVSNCENLEKSGWTSEYAREKLDVANRAKKYYENGTITIAQACQAIELASPTLPYDPTFSLPD